MAALNVLAYIVAWLVSAAMVVTTLLSGVFLVAEHRVCKRKLAATLPAPPPVTGTSQRNGCCGGVTDRGHTTTCPEHGLWMETTPARPTLDPDIAWALADDPDPAAVARLQKELNRPLAELIAEGERKAIAMRYPLKGNPAEARVVAPPLTEQQTEVLRKRLLESTRHVLVLPRDSTYIPLGGNTTTRYTGSCVPAGGGGSGGSNAIYTFPAGVVTANKDAWRATSGRREPEVLARLREQRLHYWTRAHHLANHACVANRAFTDPEDREWQGLMEQMEVLDKRIAAVLDMLDSTRL